MPPVYAARARIDFSTHRHHARCGCLISPPQHAPPLPCVRRRLGSTAFTCDAGTLRSTVKLLAVWPRAHTLLAHRPRPTKPANLLPGQIWLRAVMPTMWRPCCDAAAAARQAPTGCTRATTHHSTHSTHSMQSWQRAGHGCGRGQCNGWLCETTRSRGTRPALPHCRGGRGTASASRGRWVRPLQHGVDNTSGPAGGIGVCTHARTPGVAPPATHTTTCSALH